MSRCWVIFYMWTHYIYIYIYIYIGEGASLALVGHPSSGGVTIKIPYEVYIDVLHRPN